MHTKDEAAEYGGILSLSWFPSGWGGPRQRQLQLEKSEHKTEATWGNRLGGDMFWPSAKRVAVEQQDHPTWKGKAAPKA